MALNTYVKQRLTMRHVVGNRDDGTGFDFYSCSVNLKTLEAMIEKVKATPGMVGVDINLDLNPEEKIIQQLKAGKSGAEILAGIDADRARIKAARAKKAGTPPAPVEKPQVIPQPNASTPTPVVSAKKDEHNKSKGF